MPYASLSAKQIDKLGKTNNNKQQTVSQKFDDSKSTKSDRSRTKLRDKKIAIHVSEANSKEEYSSIIGKRKSDRIENKKSAMNDIQSQCSKKSNKILKSKNNK